MPRRNQISYQSVNSITWRCSPGALAGLRVHSWQKQKHGRERIMIQRRPGRCLVLTGLLAACIGTECTNLPIPAPTANDGAGSNSSAAQQEVPLICDAGGPYTAECAGAATTVALDGSGSTTTTDPLTYTWTTDC